MDTRGKVIRPVVFSGAPVVKWFSFFAQSLSGVGVVTQHKTRQTPSFRLHLLVCRPTDPRLMRGN